MFGCIVAGRLIQTITSQIDESHFAIDLPCASTINHVCVFLLGTVPFPEGFGATVHLFWPGKGFQLLGALSNEKPSAIFRLRGSYSANPSVANTSWANPSAAAAASTEVTAILGFAIESLASIQPQLDALASSVMVKPMNSLNDATVLAEKILKHIFNYLSSFAEGSGGGGMSPDSYVQMRVLTKWYEAFMMKLRSGGTGFLDRME